MNRLRNDLLAALGFVFLISTPAFTGLPVRYAAPNPQVDQKMKGQQPSRAEVEQELKSLLKRIFDQLARLDFEMLKQTLADDFILTTGHGTVETRDEVFQRLANHSPDARLESIAATDIKARIYGEAAVITSRTTIIAQSKGRFSPTEWRATYVFVKRDGHWQMVGAQYTISNDKETEKNRGRWRAQKSRGCVSKIGDWTSAYLVNTPPTFLCSPDTVCSHTQ